MPPHLPDFLRAHAASSYIVAAEPRLAWRRGTADCGTNAMTAHPRDRHSPDNGKGRRSLTGSGIHGEKRGNRSRDQQGGSAARNESRSRPAGGNTSAADDFDDCERSFSRYLAIDEESE
jgi:hypothetical protein